MPKIIHAISGPRNISTAIMYSFAQRPGCSVFDEPLYGIYLKDFYERGVLENLDSLVGSK